MKLKALIAVVIIIIVLVVFAGFWKQFGDADNSAVSSEIAGNKCAWAKYSNYYSENGFMFCCRLVTNENGDYGVNDDGTPALNNCEARPENE